MSSSKDKKIEIYEVEAEMFEANSCFPNMMVLSLKWEASIGFGTLSFMYNTEKRNWEYDSECMGEEFCKAVLNKWIEDMMGRKEE